MFQDPSDLEIQMEAERVVVCDFAQEMHAVTDDVDILIVGAPESELSPRLTQSTDTKKQKMKKLKPR